VENTNSSTYFLCFSFCAGGPLCAVHALQPGSFCQILFIMTMPERSVVEQTPTRPTVPLALTVACSGKLALLASDLRRTVYMCVENVRLNFLDVLVIMGWCILVPLSQTLLAWRAEELLCSAIRLRAYFVEATRQDGLCAESVSVLLLDFRLAATLGGRFHLWRRFCMECGER
jgi:hypothetical protein